MLLPQSPAYHTLKNRLSAVPEMGLLRLQLAQKGVIAAAADARLLPKASAAAGKSSSSSDGGGSSGGGGGGDGDFKKLFATYQEVQARHLQHLLRSKDVKD